MFTLKDNLNTTLVTNAITHGILRNTQPALKSTYFALYLQRSGSLATCISLH